MDITSVKGEDFLVIEGLVDGESEDLESVEVNDVTITDEDGNAITAEDLVASYDAGTVIEYAVDGAGYVTDIKVVFNVDDAVKGASISVGDEADVAYFFGMIGTNGKVTGSAKAIELVEEYDGAVIADVATAGSGMLGTIYTVDLTARNTKISTDTGISDYLDSVVEDVLEDEYDEDVYCAFVKVYENDTVDIVVYTVQ